jgi:hypothetical protein
MTRYTLIPLFLLLAALLAACDSLQPAPPRLAITPFPTQTPGRVIQGLLPPVDAVSQNPGLSNPATAAAVVAQPTPTPDLTSCPPLSTDAEMESTPPLNAQIVTEEIIRYLNAGGDAQTLGRVLREDWGLIGEEGSYRSDLDLTGENTPEILVSFTTPEGGSALLIAGCREGLYQPFYQVQANGPQPPQFITIGDMNNSGNNELLFSTQECPDREAAFDPDDCRYRTRLLSWQPSSVRFVDLLIGDVISVSLPTITDFDNDQVTEIIIRLEDAGTVETGPLRTGTHVYDWNGEAYVLSIVEIEPPRFKIQVIHEADRAFSRREMDQAMQLYDMSLSNNALRYWFNDEVELVRSYSLYRMMLAQVVAQRPTYAETYQMLLIQYPDAALRPVYAEMAQVFYDTFIVSADVSEACAAVQQVIAARPEAVTRLNRYGSFSPTYTAEELCPY